VRVGHFLREGRVDRHCRTLRLCARERGRALCALLLPPAEQKPIGVEATTYTNVNLVTVYWS